MINKKTLVFWAWITILRSKSFKNNFKCELGTVYILMYKLKLYNYNTLRGVYIIFKQSSKRLKIILSFFITFIICFILYLSMPTKIHTLDIGTFTPIRNDELAKKFTPSIFTSSKDDIPKNIFYRAAIDNTGNTHIAYHILWDKEVNNSSGILPLLNRCLYTGGLKIQEKIFGKGDIEVIEVILDKHGHPTKLSYETAKDYDPTAFSVTHETIVKATNSQIPLNFEVVSWNHMFHHIEDSTELENLVKTHLQPEYFEDELWMEYEIFKEKERIFNKSRAHYIYERKSAKDI